MRPDPIAQRCRDKALFMEMIDGEPSDIKLLRQAADQIDHHRKAASRLLAKLNALAKTKS